MKKMSFKKPTQHTRQTLLPTRAKPECDRETVPNRKASTPKKNDGSSASMSPDISGILNNESNETSISKTQLSKKSINPKKLLDNKPATSKKEELAAKLDLEYTRYLQSVFQNKLNQNKSSDLDNDLENIQRRIEKNQDMLQKTTQRLKNINFNKEIDLLHSLKTPNYGQTLEKLNSLNCEEYLSRQHEQLKQSSNQLKVKNIEIPEGGAAQLGQLLTDTIEAFKEVQSDNEAWKTLKNIQESNTSTSLAIARCKESLPDAEHLSLTYSTMKLCEKD